MARKEEENVEMKAVKWRRKMDEVHGSDEIKIEKTAAAGKKKMGGGNGIEKLSKAMKAA